MVILPLKPVAKIISLLGALVFCGYLASACIDHKNHLVKITGEPNRFSMRPAPLNR